MQAIGYVELSGAVEQVLAQFPGAKVLQGTAHRIIDGERVSFLLIGFGASKIEVYANGDVREVTTKM